MSTPLHEYILYANDCLLCFSSLGYLHKMLPGLHWFWHAQKDFLSSPHKMHDNATSASAPSAILARADKSWNHTCPHIPFGDSYHGWFPSTLAWQILGLKTIIAAMSIPAISTEGFMLCILPSIPHLIHCILLSLAVILAASLLHFPVGMLTLLLACPACQFLRVEHPCKYSFST